MLFALQVLHLAFQSQTPLLQTKTALPAGLLQVMAIAVATGLSWLEDQRSVRPSDLMVIYFFLASILSFPRLRSLWLLSSEARIPAILWSLVSAGMLMVLVLESIHKTYMLRTPYKRLSQESTASLWTRSLFIWTLPLIRNGFCSVISISNLPNVDDALRGDAAERKLHVAWTKCIVL